MEALREGATVAATEGQKEAEMMGTVFLVVVIAFVVAVLAIVGYTLFELTPWASHKDHYRDAAGKRRYESPRLD
jgi:hypothetical protein